MARKTREALLAKAGAERKQVSFLYNGVERVADAYSYRTTSRGTIVLMARERGINNIKAFALGKVFHTRVLDKTFKPEWAVEV